MIRAALLGDPALLEVCAPARTAALEPAATLADADVAIAFEPTAAQLGELAERGLPTISWWRGAQAAAPVDGAAPTRAISTAPGLATGAPVWRTVALPVSDRLFAPAAAPAGHDRRAAWIGAPTARRTAYLTRFTGSAPIAEDEGPESTALVGVALADADPDGHGARVALARGRLLVAEPLEPGHGLEPGIDHLCATVLDEVQAHVANALRHPEAVERVRLLGRRKAELFRASTVIGRLAGDLLLELDAAVAR